PLCRCHAVAQPLLALDRPCALVASLGLCDEQLVTPVQFAPHLCSTPTRAGLSLPQRGIPRRTLALGNLHLRAQACHPRLVCAGGLNLPGRASQRVKPQEASNRVLARLT